MFLSFRAGFLGLTWLWMFFVRGATQLDFFWMVVRRVVKNDALRLRWSGDIATRRQFTCLPTDSTWSRPNHSDTRGRWTSCHSAMRLSMQQTLPSLLWLCGDHECVRACAHTQNVVPERSKSVDVVPDMSFFVSVGSFQEFLADFEDSHMT